MSIVFRGWTCSGCRVFNGEEKDRRSECRCCGCARPSPPPDDLEWIDGPYGADCASAVIDDAELLAFFDGRWAVRLRVIPDTPEPPVFLRTYVTRANGRERTMERAKERARVVHRALTEEL